MKPIPSLSVSDFPLSNKKLEQIGLKLTPGGSHISRTIMLGEITQLFKGTQPESSIAEYRKEVVVSNMLSKNTVSTREKTFRHLRELYMLSQKYPLFRVFRYLADYDSKSLPQLALLVSWARDPLLRSSTPAVFRANIDSEILKDQLIKAITQEYGTRYSELNIDKIARNTGSSWTQSGHLSGRTRKIRKEIHATVASLAMALYMAHMCGLAGEHLLRSPWVQLLDLSPDQARTQAAQLSRERLIDLHAVGSVVDMTFPKLDKIVRWEA